MYIGYIFDFKPYNQFHIKGEKQRQIYKYAGINIKHNNKL